MITATLEQLKSVKTAVTEQKIVQSQEKTKTNKYKHIKKTTDKNGTSYSVTEYVCPNGKLGFDIIFYKTIDEKDYRKTICYGEEATSRQYDWLEIIKD